MMGAMNAKASLQPWPAWRARLHEIIFEAETPAGKAFDVALLIAILLSVLVVVLESVPEIRQEYGPELVAAEWFFTILFTIEYILRLLAVRHPLSYAKSFFGVVDLMAVLPTYLSLLFSGTQALAVVRALRLLRIFRVFKIARYLHELTSLVTAVKATRAKIAVFLLTVLILVLIVGTGMYVVEGEESGFDSIPRGVYWAIVTVTTVGYGDIAPRTLWGQGLASAAMIIGYCLIIIPTGIFSVELIQAGRRKVSTESCPTCSHEGHDADAKFCKRCGSGL